MRFNKLFVLVLVLLLVLVGAACGKKGEEAENEQPATETEGGEVSSEITFPELDRTDLGADKVVATYEGGEVKGDVFAQYLSVQGFFQPSYPINDPEFRKQAIEFLIAEKTILSLTTDEHSKAAEENVNMMWEQLELRYDEATRKRGFDTLQITEEDIKAFLSRYFTTEAYFKSQITEEQVVSSYNEMIPDLTTASVRHILVATEEMQPDGTRKEIRTEEEAKARADELYQQLQGGADFAELATEHTDDPGSKESGGLYADAPVGQWVPEFKQAALEQELNKIGQPVKTDFGYHIIRVESREVEELDEVREYLTGRLAEEKLMNYFQNELPGKIKEIHL